jgi:hypothetical protein
VAGFERKMQKLATIITIVIAHIRERIVLMSTQPLIAHLTGNPNVPTIREANVRNVPGTLQPSTVLFKMPIGTMNLTVLEVSEDSAQTQLNGKTFQWFRLSFPNGQQGWVRDDLVQIVGDGRPYGYVIIPIATYAFSLRRIYTPGTASTTAPIVMGQPLTPIPTAPAITPVGTTTTAPPPTTTTAPPPTTTTAPPPVITPVGTTTTAPPPTTTTAPPPATTTTAPPPATTTTAPPPAPAVPTGAPTFVMISKTGANLRSAPINGTVIRRLNYLEEGTVIGGQVQGNNTNYVWVRVRAGANEGWVRNSFLRIRGNAANFSLSSGDEYAAPMKNCWWVRGFGISFANNDPNEVSHNGWDLGANNGEPMLTGPRGGVVTQIHRCTKCTAAQPNTLSQGLSIGDSNVFSDAAWGFGYGHFVVVRYDHNLLPESTKLRLAQQNKGGMHLFVMYAHLNDFTVNAGQQLSAGQQFGGCGNTGNSEAAHLHLEVRAGSNPNAQWFEVSKGLVEPGVLFSR